MKKLMTAVTLSLAAAAFSLPAQAKNAACDATAAEKKLAGAAKASFLKKCEADAAVATPAPAASASAPVAAAAAPAAPSCETKADDKKLAGAAKASFVKKCEKDAQADAAKTGCEATAGEKKLAGAAKNSFVKKCVSDAAK